MIYTVTLNPALDYIIKMNEFKTGEINRSKDELIFPGGKGINVSIVLKEIGIDSVALGLAGGFIGEEIETQLKKKGIKTDFIKVKNNTSRINIKILTPYEETAINCEGLPVDEEYIQILYRKLEIIQDDDWIILSGSVPKGVQEDIYQNICNRLSKKNVRIIVDTTGEFLLKTLKYHPFLIKPNKHELEDIFDVDILNKEDAIKYAKVLRQKGAQNVLISMGKEGAVLVDVNEKCYKMNAMNQGKRISTVGAGDSVVAGFLAGFLMFDDYEKALKMGMAAGAATANSIFLATKDEIYELFE